MTEEELGKKMDEKYEKVVKKVIKNLEPVQFLTLSATALNVENFNYLVIICYWVCIYICYWVCIYINS